MANSALGAALTIPQSALDAIEQADKKLKDIQDTAKNTAASVTKSFDNMAIGTKPFLDALDQVINKLNIVGTSATNASGGLNNIGASAGTMSGNITQASVNVQNMVAQLSKMNGSGTSGIMQAVLAFQRLQEATKGASGMNIAELKQEIGAIDSMLKDVDYNLTKTDQDALIKRKKMLQDELKYQQQMYEERAVAFQKALDKMVSAEQSYNNKQKRSYADRAKNYQDENYKYNTSYQGALDFSATANTLNRQVRAIEYLKEARMKLSTVDADYKHKLETLNAAIAEHNKKLKEAGINTKQLGEQTSYMAGYLSRWAQRMAFAFSISSIRNFAEQLTDVRGQFELSQRSLEAILQNKPKADQIFNKTVELAVKSPFRIKDLVDYTRQLSAYRIESNKLYDTTKRLADVSAGLDVDMGRLILAYGQVKAAAYLRGSEVRQFTEAGVNMYGELQQYFKEVKGEAYTTAQIVDMISKRKVTFEDVEAIFQRMTDKGGTFYNMQEIQAETLQGKISNLKDAFDVMLNDIGKSNEGLLKGTISSTTELLNSWKTIVNVAKLFAGLLGSIYITTKLMNGAWGQTAANIMASHKRLGVFKALMAALTGDTGKLGSTFATLGNTIKASLPLAALTAVIALVQELISVNNEYKEAMAKNTKEYYTAQVRVEEIDQEAKTNIQKALQDLVKEMNQKGFEVTIGVNLSDEEARKQYEIFLNDYQEFLDSMRAIDAKYEANKKKGWLMGDDDIETDMQEYTSSMGEFLQKGDDIRSILAQVSKESINLTDSQKEMFKQLAAGPQKGQGLLDYYAKVAKALKELGYIQNGWFDSKQNMVGILGGTGNNGYDWGIGANADEQLSKFTLAYETYIKNLEEVRKEAQNVFGDVSKYQDEASKKKLEIQINNEALKRRWGDIEKDMLYKAYSIKVNIDKNNTQKEVSWVDDFIRKFFAEKKYGITLSVNEIKNTSSIDEYLDKSKEYAETAQKWKKVYDSVSKATVKEYAVKGSFKDLLQNTLYADAPTITKKQLMALAKSRMKENTIASKKLFGIDPFEKQNNKAAKQRAKEQRDILQERISLLKDMNAKYNELIKVESKEQALTDTRKYFKEAAQNVGWNANDILPDDASVIKRIREIGAKFKELTKRGNAFRIAADISVNMNKEKIDKIREDISHNIDEAFSSLNLYKKLKGENLTDDIIKNLFGDLTTSFKDVEKKMNQEFNKYTTAAYEKEYGTDHTKWDDKVIQEYNSKLEHTEQAMAKLGKKQNKEYQDAKKKLNEQVYQDQVNQAQELIKAYKQQLSDQLQLDKWYIEELQKIQNNANLAKNPELQKQLQDNLDTQYKKKTGENTWKNFQGSDMYVKIFENLDQTSTKVLDYMIQKLQSLKSEMKNLDPTQVKAIAEQIEKLQAQKNSRNPFKAFTTGLKELIKYTKEYKKLGGDNALISTSDKYDKEEKEIENQNKLIANLNAEYEKSKSVNGLNNDKTKTLGTNLNLSKRQLKSLEKQHNETKDTLDTLNKAQDKTDNAKNKFSQSVQDITSIVSSMTTAFRGLFEALGGSDEGLEETLNIVDNIGQAVGSYYSGNYAGVVSGAMGAITDAIKLFNTKDKKLQREIERHQKVVDKLKEAYDDLKEAMDNAYNIAKLSKYSDEMIKNLELQNQNLQSMIAAERDKKDTDDSKIEEWQKQIEANNKAIKEAEETLTEQLGGFGTKANYKSAAEAFADVWVDAFNEGSDALKALNGKFDEYFNNLLKKQLMARAAARFIQPILDAVDAAVAKGSEGGNDGLEVTSGELKKLQELKNTNLQAFNEYANTLMKVLGVTSKGTSKLSNLQQGIQSVSEATAQALESIINSIRYFVAQQQSDVAAIRNILEVRLGAVTAQGESGGSSNQMIALMEQQAGYLHEICDNWSSVLKGGHKQGGKGIKVFMS